MACSAAVCTWRFRENGSHFETTKGQSSLHTTTNHQQPFSAGQRSELDDSGHQKSEYPNCGVQKGSGRFWLKLQSFTAKSTILATTWTLKTSRSLLSKPITTNDFSLKPGTLLWTQTLGTIITYFQKPRRASREHELNGHKRKLTLNSVWQQTSLSYPLMKA